ncbi:uncharacterized protein BP5553_03700 [Venustampulla echinocandica]|uniref:Aminoglycoside phosphotransferase domain-containing protein n=1 Tax=Venustampulla echinocandica TaxID=2656787 RepID=A0A370TV32_9HELO|nr:uncharacterized protein BP5553_03700 [Venustampulla echinocandica]RDL39360.1 hypothetical protein BP5553_03700 [Venustampulla echinocandica]
MAPSDSWTSYQNMSCDSEQARKIQQLLLTANFPFLCTTAVQLRSTLAEAPQAIGQTLTCSIDSTKFASGMNNVVVELRFSDSEYWIARIRLPTNPIHDAAVEASIRSEITTINLVSSRTSIPIPKVYGSDVSTTNPFGFRYILMEALPGHVPDSSFAKTVPQSKWDKVAEQFADYYFQLSNLRFDHIGSLSSGLDTADELSIAPYNGSGPFSTSLEYFHNTRKKQTRAIKSAHGNDEQWSTAAWILEQALPAMVVEEYVRGPFPLCHMDLHYGNILVDDDYNITGIIDWSDAQTVPLERFIITPEFAMFPGLSDEKSAPSIAFREKFAAVLRTKELAARMIPDGPPPIADMLGTPLWEIVYRCTYSYHWRALTDSRLVLRQMYGEDAKFEDFMTFYKNGPVNFKGAKPISGRLRM